VREPVDLESVAGMLAAELDPVAAASGHELRVAVDGQVWCLGDDARILQIGRALATNAITHTPEGTTVTLRARRRGQRSELVVEDDGPGIPAGHRDAVFGRFYRVEGGVASGSGLGLSIARELARLMGGDVTLESVSSPTAFVLDLPGEPVPGDAPFSRENAARRRERVPGS
jgi:signal transduction histidine kinase